MFDISVLAYNIKKYREMKNISQKELAEKMFVSTQAISKWERGMSVPEIDKLCLLAELLGCSMDALVGHFEESEVTMIGIDGGGTKTEYILFNEHGKIFRRLVSDGTNPNFYGRDEVCERLKNGIKTLLAAKPNVKGIFIGGAGYLTGANKEDIKARLKNFFPTVKIRCESDMFNVVACATDAKKCLGAISGTGNVTFAYRDEEIIKYGGYGVLFDQAGSGYDIGRDGLSATFEENEGIGDETLITKLIQERLNIDKTTRLIRDFYDKDISYIASFSMEVFKAWNMGDAVAGRIIERNTDRIADLINAAYEKNPDCRTVILAGSLYKDEKFLETVKRKLSPELECIAAEKPQVLGACIHCCRLLGVDPCKLKEKFDEEYRASFE